VPGGTAGRTPEKPAPSGKSQGRERNGADLRTAGKVWFEDEKARLHREFGEDWIVIISNLRGAVGAVKAFKEARFDRARNVIIALDGRGAMRLRQVRNVIDFSFGPECKIVVEAVA